MRRSVARYFRPNKQPAKPSIYDHIRFHLVADGPGLTEAGWTLPDEPDQDGPLRWAPGARDGIAVHHLGVDPANERANEAFLLVKRAAARGGTDTRDLERCLREVDALSIVDGLLERLVETPLRASGIEAVGRRLATRSGSRNAVKIGIALLGIVPGSDNRDVLFTLGRHDEFTLYSGIALARTDNDPESTLWELAQLVEGWGRIHLVERLKTTSRPEIQGWILRAGFRNEIMDEYLAYIAATTGGLLAALSCDQPDDDVITAACDIVRALLVGAPCEGIDDYEEAPHAMQLLIGHLERRATSVHHYLVVERLEEFLGDDEDWTGRDGDRWPPVLRNRLRQTCREIRARPGWTGVALAGLASSDNVAFSEARQACRLLGIDTLEAQLERLAAEPLNAGWQAVMEVVDEARLPRVLSLAERVLPLDLIASGPADEQGFGPAFRAHMALGFLVQGLDRFPSCGWRLIAAALRSPVVMDRNAALTTLDAWSRSDWPADAPSALRVAAGIEPNDRVRDRMERLARGEPAPVVPPKVP